MIAPATLIAGRYTVVRCIGHGGMGAVYEATDQRLSTPVALKQILLSGAAAARTAAREAQILAGLHHPALPVVTDCFSEGTTQFLVMQFIPGPTLHDLFVNHPRGFPITQVTQWADQMLVLLTYLHQHTPPIIHRDIKPQNLKLAPSGALVVLDFSLAKGMVPPDLADVTHSSMGGYSLAYAPLEQLEGKAIDPRADLYALAATLYHLLSGEPPPTAADRAMALVRHQADPLRPIGTLCPALPSATQATLMQALALQPNQRPPTATVMRDRMQLQETVLLTFTQPIQPKTRTAGEIPSPTSTQAKAIISAPVPSRWRWAEWGWWVVFNGIGGGVSAIAAGTILISFIEQINHLLATTDQVSQLSASAPALLGQAIAIITIGSGLMAIVQWFYLRATIRISIAWVAASIFGVMLGLGIGSVAAFASIASIVAINQNVSSSQQSFAFTLISIPLTILATLSLTGWIIASFQNLVLKRAFGCSDWWTATTIIGLMLSSIYAIPIGWGVGLLLTDRLGWIVGLLISGLVHGTVSSAVTGVTLAWLLQTYTYDRQVL